jgi:hypothetical protein
MPWAIFSLGTTVGRLVWSTIGFGAIAAVPLVAGSSQTDRNVAEVAPQRPKYLTADNLFLMATVGGLIITGIQLWQFIHKGK